MSKTAPFKNAGAFNSMLTSFIVLKSKLSGITIDSCKNLSMFSVGSSVSFLRHPLTVKPKKRRRRMQKEGYTSKYKKTIVRLKKGQKLEELEI